jgi:predicted dehydrogenase
MNVSPLEETSVESKHAPKTLRIGMAGLDTSHVRSFAAILHDATHPHHLPGARITAAFPGGSPEFASSISKVPGFTADLRDQHGAEIVESLAALRGRCDTVMLETIDGRVHLAQFREVADWGVPVFIDKPLALTAAEAREIQAIAEAKSVPLMSTSALRFAEAFRDALQPEEKILGADFHGPMAFQDVAPGYFWYGIHQAEMLFAAMGPGCVEVEAIREGDHDIVAGRWQDGRLGVLRGHRVGNNAFGGTLHRKSGSTPFAVATGKTPFYVSLLEQVLAFFRGGSEIVPLSETVELVRFLEAANESAETRRPVKL